MRNLFDDLFNEFFGEMFNRYTSNDDFKDYLKMVAEGTAVPLSDNAYPYFNIDENNPDEIFYGEKNGLYIKTCIWHTPYGDVTHKSFRDIPFEEKKSSDENKSLTLEQNEKLLLEAIAEEKYEEAARLRDLIDGLKNKSEK